MTASICLLTSMAPVHIVMRTLSISIPACVHTRNVIFNGILRILHRSRKPSLGILLHSKVVISCLTDLSQQKPVVFFHMAVPCPFYNHVEELIILLRSCPSPPTSAITPRTRVLHQNYSHLAHQCLVSPKPTPPYAMRPSQTHHP